jgi:hypothetical protein
MEDRDPPFISLALRIVPAVAAVTGGPPTSSSSAQEPLVRRFDGAGLVGNGS